MSEAHTSLDPISNATAEKLLRGQRWFSGGERPIASAHWVDAVALPDSPFCLRIVRVAFGDGSLQDHAVITDESLQDRASDSEGQKALMHLLLEGDPKRAKRGVFSADWTADVSPSPNARARSLGAEQSNTSFIFDDRFVVKLIRQVREGANPDAELLRVLAERGFEHVPRFCGALSYLGDDGSHIDLVVATHRIEGARDGWELACAEPETLVALSPSLGKTLAELHNALGEPCDDPDIRPTTADGAERRRLVASLKRLAQATEFSRADELLQATKLLPDDFGTCMRIHGDLHLGQTLVREGQWTFLDFEGEPTRSLEERRAKTSPLKDVAGMLRSFSYAEASSSRVGYAKEVRGSFLESYHQTLREDLQPPADGFDELLAWYEIEKALYELDYEQRYRPDWAYIPRSALEGLCDRVLRATTDAPTVKVERLAPNEPAERLDPKGEA